MKSIILFGLVSFVTVERQLRKIAIELQLITILTIVGVLGSCNVQGANANAPTEQKKPNPAQQQQIATKKKWTVLVFMNGHNNLDSYTRRDLNEMENVGSTDDINVVVQWGSESAKQDIRLLVQKDNDTTQVTSPVVEQFPQVDMGDYKELQKFIVWGMQHYPADHYFVNVWNHGNGWAKFDDSRSAPNTNSLHPDNISYDSISHNSITIPDLAKALKAGADFAGKKIEIYGSDACLMAMGEVGYELAPYVDVMVGSEEVEPMDGWSYDTFLTQWNTNVDADSLSVGKILTDSYVASYASGYRGVTFSVMDLSKMPAFSKAFSDFAVLMSSRGGGTDDASLVLQAASLSQTYDSHPDYVDLTDFMANLEKSALKVSQDNRFTALKEALAAVISYNKTYNEVGNGLSVWLPQTHDILSQNIDAYQDLKFAKDTGWGNILESIVPANSTSGSNSGAIAKNGRIVE